MSINAPPTILGMLQALNHPAVPNQTQPAAPVVLPNLPPDAFVAMDAQPQEAQVVPAEEPEPLALADMDNVVPEALPEDDNPFLAFNALDAGPLVPGDGPPSDNEEQVVPDAPASPALSENDDDDMDIDANHSSPPTPQFGPNFGPQAGAVNNVPPLQLGAAAHQPLQAVSPTVLSDNDGSDDDLDHVD